MAKKEPVDKLTRVIAPSNIHELPEGLERAPVGASSTWPLKDPSLVRPPGCLDVPTDAHGNKIPPVDDEDDDDDRPDDLPEFGMPDMSSWSSLKTNSFGSFPMGGAHVAPPGAFFPQGGMPQMGAFIDMQNAMNAMPGTYFGGSAAQLEAQAAELDLRAAQLKQAALQAEMAAQHARSSFPQAAPMKKNVDLAPGAGGAGYNLGNPMMIPVPAQTPAAAAGAKEAAKPKAKKAASTATKSYSSSNSSDFTTLMLRNIPNNYNREMVLELLDAEGFSGRYDFVYLPMDFHRMAGLGYAFVNLVDNATAEAVRKAFEGFSSWKLASQKVCEVSWGEPLQGLEAHIERYRNSPVMHPDVPDKYKPVLYKDGIRFEFPEPTKKIRPPRVKKAVGKGDAGGADGDAGGGDAAD